MIFPEVRIFQPDAFEDFRGELFTFYQSDNDMGLEFNHDKVSISRQYVLRGLHGDAKSHKLVSCLNGEILLVVVDNRSDSPNYLKWDSIMITSANRIQVLIPPMFANGHLVMSHSAIFFYKWSYSGSYPDVNEQFSLKWNDPCIGIEWPITNPILSTRDK
jgi:dTDP-4-dehydrorhamnose 3,5-epimerase